MTRPWVLENFDFADLVGLGVVSSSDATLEEERLKAFDQGYQDGWEDAAKAHAEEQVRISAELASNLQGLSFTYHEARNAVLGEMETLLKGVVARVLPETMVHSLGGLIVEQVSAIASEVSEIDVEVVVCPENVERVRHLLDGMIAPPLSFRGEPSLGQGQAFIRIGRSERKIDLEGVLRGLSEAVGEFFDTSEKAEARNA